MRKLFSKKFFLIFFLNFFWRSGLEALLSKYLSRYPHLYNYLAMRNIRPPSLTGAKPDKIRMIMMIYMVVEKKLGIENRV